MTRCFVVEADGHSRGESGIAAGGAVVIDDETGETVAERGVFMGIATDDVACYSGVLAGLEAAFAREPHATVRVRSHSRLVMEQLSGRFRVTHPNAQVLARRAHALIADRDVSFEWTPREENARAHSAANACMDLRESFSRDFDGETG